MGLGTTETVRGDGEKGRKGQGHTRGDSLKMCGRDVTDALHGQGLEWDSEHGLRGSSGS